jgi:hypothetical protein
MVAGFLGARFLKASSRSRSRWQASRPTPQATPAPPLPETAWVATGEADLYGTPTEPMHREAVGPRMAPSPLSPLPVDDEPPGGVG